MRLMPLRDSIDKMVSSLEADSFAVTRQPDLEKRYPLSIEPPSALFVDAVSVSVIGYQEPENPLDVEVYADVQQHWTPHALRVLDMITSSGLDPIYFERTGAVYQTGYQNKRNKRVINYADLLNEQYAYSVYNSDFYNPQLLADLMLDYKEQAIYSISVLDQDPDLLLVGKASTTGTGYISPWNDRERMAEHWASLSPTLQQAIPPYYDDLAYACQQWPQQGAEIMLPYEFRGIRKGCRSDGTVERWLNTNPAPVTGVNPAGDEDSMQPSPSLGYQQVSSKTRAVGNDPSSCLFNKGTVTKDWHHQIWQKYASPYHVMPFEPGVIERFLATKPLTMPADDDEIVLACIDWSYQEHGPYMDNGSLVIPDPGRKFGADNFVLGGIQLITAHEYIIYMLCSGCPFTMDQYLVTAGSVVGNVLSTLGAGPDDAEILQVGDDINMRIRKCFVGPMLDLIGNYCNMKGMGIHG